MTPGRKRRSPGRSQGRSQDRSGGRSRRKKAESLRLGEVPVRVATPKGTAAADFKLAVKLTRAWPSIVGERFAERVALLKVVSDQVLLGALDHVTAQEIELLGPDLIERMRGHLGRRKIKSVRCRVISEEAFPSPSTPDPIEEESESPSQTEASLDPSTRAQLEKALARVDDLELRERLRRVLLRARARDPES